MSRKDVSEGKEYKMKLSQKPPAMRSSTHRTTYSSEEQRRYAEVLPFTSPPFDKDKHMPKNEVVAILCSGPNLELYDPEYEYGLVIGVNRGSIFHECDWLVALDVSYRKRQTAFTKEWCDINGYPKGNPKVYFGGGGGISSLRKITDWLPDNYEMPKAFPGELNWPWLSFSLFGAIMLAYRLGAEIIHCYGVTWEGNLDFDGKGFRSRDEARWMTEQFMFKQAMEWLETKGVKLRRIFQPIGEEYEVEVKEKEYTYTHIEAGMTLGVEGGEFRVKVTKDEEADERDDVCRGSDGVDLDDHDTIDLDEEELEEKEICDDITDPILPVVPVDDERTGNAGVEEGTHGGDST